MSIKELKDALNCPVCLDPCKDAMFLPECGHTLCSVCIGQIAERHATENANSTSVTFPCPECRMPSSLARKDLKKPNFKRNYLVDRVVEALSKDSEPKVKIQRLVGEFCPHVTAADDSSAVECKHCNNKFCEFCIPTHADLVKAEIEWATLDFDRQIEHFTTLNDQFKTKLKDELKANADSARKNISKSLSKLIAELTNRIELKCNALLGDIDLRQRNVHNSINNMNLPSEITATELESRQREFIKAFDGFRCNSLLLSDLEQLSPVYQSTKLIDQSLQTAKAFYEKSTSQVSIDFSCQGEKILEDFQTLLERHLILKLGAEFNSNPPEQMAHSFGKTHFFHSLVKTGNLSEIRLMLEDQCVEPIHLKFIINHRDSSDFERTAVMQASFCGRFDVVRYLVENHKPNLYLMDSEGNMALTLALKADHRDIAEYLLNWATRTENLMSVARTKNQLQLRLILSQLFSCSKLPNEDEIDMETVSAIELAIALGQTELLQKLRRSNEIDLGQQFDNGRYALHVAAMFGQLETVKFLLHEFPEQLDRVDGTGYTPFLWAVSSGCLSLVEHILRNYPKVAFDVKSNDNGNAMMVACSNGHFEVVKYLVPFVPFVANKNGFHPIHEASRSGSLKLVQFLIQGGWQSGFEHDRDNETPLTFAAITGSLEMTHFFIEHYRKSIGIDKQKWILSRELSGLEPTHHAVMNGHFQVLVYLLENTHSFKAKDDAGNNLLHVAVKSYLDTEQCLNIVSYLMKRCPQLATSRNLSNRTPIKLAKRMKVDKTIVAMLESNS